MSKSIWLISSCVLFFVACSAKEPVEEVLSSTSPASTVTARPNFLLVVTDDMGYTDLGAFGGHDIPTPNLDRLAMDGVRLTNFHTNVSCAPTRSMLLSGTGNHEAGMGSQQIFPEFRGLPGYEGLLSERVASLPQRMQAGGYHTYMAGKWHLGGSAYSVLPSDRGFERSFALLPGGWDHFALEPGAEKPDVGPARDVPYTEDGRLLDKLPGDFYSTTAYVDKMISYLSSNKDSEQPFFAYFAPTAPHWPLQVLPEWKDRFAGAFDAGYEALCYQRQQDANKAGVLPAGADLSICPEIAEPWSELSEDDKALNRRTMELYAAMVAHLDTEFGRLLDYLEKSGELDNTYIIYHNDNGPEGGDIINRRSGLQRFNNSLENIGNRDSWVNVGQGWADAQSAPFREDKGSPFEGGIRVPAFIKAPQSSEQGRISGSLLTVMDVLPTILELAGIEQDSYENSSELLPIRGASFAPLLADLTAVIHDDKETIALDHAGISFLIQGDWKISRRVDSDIWQLFNKQEDPSELNDLATQQPKKLAELVAGYEAHAAEVGIVRRKL